MKKPVLILLNIMVCSTLSFNMLATSKSTSTRNKGGGESTLLTNVSMGVSNVGLKAGSQKTFRSKLPALANIIIDNTEETLEPEESIPEEPIDDTPKKDCGEGKFLNPKTNRCKNLQTISETTTGKTITTYDPETGEATTIKVCNDGYVLNAETNRCNKIKSETDTKQSSQVKTCTEGQFLNPKTNRCKNIQTVVESSTGKTVTTYDPETGEAKTEKICNDGYSLDKEANRCKKIKENKGEDYAIEVPELGNERTDFVAVGSVVAITMVGIGFVVFQFRHEIMKFFRRFKRQKP